MKYFFLGLLSSMFFYTYAQDMKEYSFQQITYSFNKYSMQYDTSLSYFKLQWTSNNSLIFIDSVRKGKPNDTSYVIGKYIVDADGIKLYKNIDKTIINICSFTDSLVNRKFHIAFFLKGEIAYVKDTTINDNVFLKYYLYHEGHPGIDIPRYHGYELYDKKSKMLYYSLIEFIVPKKKYIIETSRIEW